MRKGARPFSIVYFDTSNLETGLVLDVDECVEAETPLCGKNTFCANNEGSYKCMGESLFFPPCVLGKEGHLCILQMGSEIILVLSVNMLLGTNFLR